MDNLHFFITGEMTNSTLITYYPNTTFSVYFSFSNKYILLSQQNYEMPHKMTIYGFINPVIETYRQYFISFNQNIVNKQPSKWQSLNLFHDPSKHLEGKTYLNLVND